MVAPLQTLKMAVPLSLSLFLAPALAIVSPLLPPRASVNEAKASAVSLVSPLSSVSPVPPGGIWEECDNGKPLRGSTLSQCLR